MTDSKLTEADLPITVVGNRIYSSRQSSPIATAWDDAKAKEGRAMARQALERYRRFKARVAAYWSGEIDEHP